MHIGRGHMNLAVAPALDEAIPKPSDGEIKIVDSKGDTLSHGRDSLMTRLNEKKHNVSTAFLALIAVVPAFLMVVFYWGGSLLGIVRDDTEQRIQIERLTSDVTDIKTTLKDMQKAAEQKALKDAEARGYQLGQTDVAGEPHPKK